MQKILRFFLFSLVSFAFTSCVITRDLHFNEDFSGSQRMEIDLTRFLALAESMDSTGKGADLDTLETIFYGAKEEYENLGAKNVKADWVNEEKKAFYLSFDFDNIDHLNKISRDGTLTNEMEITFARKRNKLKLQFPPSVPSDSLGGEKGFVTCRLHLSFDKKIKKHDLPEALLSQDQKKLTLEASAEDLFSEKYENKNFEIKLQKR